MEKMGFGTVIALRQPSRSVCFGRTQPQIRTDEGTLTGALSDPTRGRARMRSVPVPHALTAAPFPLLISTTYMGGGLANALLIEVLGRARSGPATDDVSLNLRRGYDDCVEVVAQEQTTAWFTPDILFHMSALSTTWSHRGCLANWQARARTLFGVL